MRTVSRKVLIGTAVAAVVLVAAWWLLLWAPRSKDYKAAQASVTAAQSQVSQLQAQVARLRSLSAQSGALKTELTSLDNAVPTGPDMANFILAANDASVKSGVNLTTIAPTEPTAAQGSAAAQGATPITVTMSITGGYYQMLDFINRLDSLPRLVMIDSVNASASNAGGPELNVTLKGRVFEVKPTGSAATASVGGNQ